MDSASLDILLTDILLAFHQRLEGQEITLEPVTTSWREWSQRCSGLSTHPAVLDTRDYWLSTATRANLSVVGAESVEAPETGDLARLSAALTVWETGELDDARRRLNLSLDEVLLGALGRTIAVTTGEGGVAVDLAGAGRSVLKPDVDLHRTVGWFTTIYPVVITCAAPQKVGARQLFEDVKETLGGVPHYGIGYGLLRYLYAPTARRIGAARSADILLSNLGAVPVVETQAAEDAPVQFDSDSVMPIRDAVPGLGHAIELRVYRAAGVLHLDWWYDTRRLGSTDVESLARHFSAALIESTREALAAGDVEEDDDDLMLVDLSATDSG